MPIITPDTARTHLRIAVIQDAVERGETIIDVRTGYNPLVKELGYRAVAVAPDLAGTPWVLNCRTAVAGASAPALVLEAHADSNGRLVPLSVLHVPVTKLAWLALDLAAAYGVTGQFTYQVTVHDRGDDVVQAASSSREDGAIAFDDDDDDHVLRLPTTFVAGPPPWRSEPGAGAPGWLRCLFRRAAYLTFLGAARAERTCERSWLGLGRTFVTPAAGVVAIEELVGPLPAVAAGAQFIHTRGRDIAPYYQRYGDRIVAYLHLHPRAADGAAVTPKLSAQDHDVAWNVDNGTRALCAFPIALFETDPDAPGGDVAVHGYVRGTLCPLAWEVTADA
jgi:hypothetical protein